MKFNAGSVAPAAAFAYQKFSSKPDIVLIAKPLAAGLPLGRNSHTRRPLPLASRRMHGTTFGGGPLLAPPRLNSPHRRG